MASASAWGAAPASAAVSLVEVMSEQLADRLHCEELGQSPVAEAAAVAADAAPLDDSACSAVDEDASGADVSSDMLLAAMLQAEFDREFDAQIGREERQFNGDAKVRVSYGKYRVCPDLPIFRAEEDEEEQEEAGAGEVWDSFEKREALEPHIPACGYTVHDDRMVTKHDLHIDGRRNACKLMNLPPDVSTGDGGRFDMEVNSGVLSSLRKHARSEQQRKQRVHDKEDRATAGGALDRATRLALLKLVNADFLERLNGVISTGKEAFVFHAQGGAGTEEIAVPEHCAVKVFKTVQSQFKTREKYIRDDHRFKDRVGRKQNQRKQIHLWAEKELCNLKRLMRAGVRCPRPVVLREHVLVLGFIGEGERAAPQLKQCRLSESQWRDAYRQLVEMMCTMFSECRLVHADLSEYNVLYHAGLCWIIDVSQSVEPWHPHALEFLHRDCSNVSRFFRGRGVTEALSAEQLFEKVSGLELAPSSGDLFEQIMRHQETGVFHHGGLKRTEESALSQLEAAEPQVAV